MMLEWPNFKKLTLDDQVTIKALTAKFPPYSDYNFVSLWTYNILDEASWSILNDNLVMKFQSYTSDDFFYSFLGTNKPLETVKTLLARSKELGLSDKLSLVPERSIAGVVSCAGGETPPLQLECMEDRDNFDYIFDVEAIATLEGKAFATHRNMAHRFERRVGDFTVKLIDICQPAKVNEVKKLFRIWEESRHKKEAHEFKAVARLLRDAKNFEGLVSLGIYVDDQLEAWGVSEIVGNSYAVAHYRKANAAFPGIFTILEQEIAKELVKRNVKYLNFEQDLGIPGLRHSKEGWRPVAFLKKYTIA